VVDTIPPFDGGVRDALAAVNELGIQTLEVLVPALFDAGDIIGDASKLFLGLSESLQEVGLKASFVASVAGTLLLGPFGSIPAALGGAATAAVLFRDELAGVADALKRGLGDTAGLIASDLATATDSLQRGIGDVAAVVDAQLPKITAAWREHADTVDAVATEAYTAVRDTIAGSLMPGEEPVVATPLSLTVTAFEDNYDEIVATTETFVTQNRMTLSAVSTAFDRQLVGPLSNSESRISQTLRSTASEFDETFSMIRSTVSKAMTALLSTSIRPGLENIGRLYREHMTGPNGILANTRTAFNSILNNVIRPALNQIQSLWRAFDSDVLTLLRGTFGTLETIVTLGMDSMLTSINVVLDLISGDFDGAWSSIKGLTKRSIREISDWAKTSGKNLLDGAIGIIVTAVKRRFNGLYDWLIGDSLIPDLINDSASWIKTTGKEKIKSAFGVLSTGIEDSLDIDLSDVTDTVGDLIDDVADAIDRLQELSNIEINKEMPNFGGGGDGDDGDDGDEDSDSGDGDDGDDGSDGGDDGEFPDTPVSNPDPSNPSESEEDRGLIPGFASGGMVAESGLAMLHSPELVLSKRETAQAQQGGVAVGDLDVSDDVARGVA
jgi:phage-related protein